MNKDFQTICAISTPLVSGAISIVRMSGSEAVSIASKHFTAKNKTKVQDFTPRMLYLGTFSADGFSEQCLCVYFKSPNSFTGEDMIEFQCHGGVFVTKSILSALLKSGAKMATAGEFTKRAFLNGKMSLSSAEGMMDIINAESEAEIRAGYSLLSGGLSKIAFEGQNKLIDLLSDIEVSLDYPEEDIEQITRKKIQEELSTLINKVKMQVESGSTGKLIKGGVNVAILGEPNVGKSSLLNALINDEKAIVTPIAGTTRDIVEASLTIRGLKFNLFDTAGIRETTDEVEKIGVEKAKNLISSASIILLLSDDKNKKIDVALEKLLKGKKVVNVLNKSDKTGDYSVTDSQINISTKTGKNLDQLLERLYSLATEGKDISNGVIVTNERHLSLLNETLTHLNNALISLKDQPIDLVTIDLNLAYQTLGQITGNTSSEDVINAIFSKFCLGK